MNPFFTPNIPVFPSWPRLCFNCRFGHFKNRDKRNLPFTPILASVNRLVRYHLGTVAKGSFIITLVKIPRMILMYIHSQLKGKVRGKYVFGLSVGSFQTSLLHPMTSYPKLQLFSSYSWQSGTQPFLPRPHPPCALFAQAKSISALVSKNVPSSVSIQHLPP